MDLELIVEEISHAEKGGSDFWEEHFRRHILQTHNPHSDDLLYFVRKTPPSNPNGGAATEELLFVKRRKGNELSLSQQERDDIRWKETFYLNLVVQLKCSLTVAICKKGVSGQGTQTMNALSYVSKRVYASPNKTRMDKKGAEYSCSFPLIFFNVEDFEDTFSNVIINADEYFCVELAVVTHDKDEGKERQGKEGDRASQKRVIIFQGAVGWEALSSTFRKKTGTAKESHVEYIMMRGPQGKGHAQVAVSIPTPSGASSPSSSSSSISAPASSTSSTSSANSSSLKRPNLIQGLLKLSQQYYQPPETPLEKLKCCLTFVNVSWQSIVNDINSTILKGKNPA